MSFLFICLGLSGVKVVTVIYMALCNIMKEIFV